MTNFSQCGFFFLPHSMSNAKWKWVPRSKTKIEVKLCREWQKIVIQAMWLSQTKRSCETEKLCSARASKEGQKEIWWKNLTQKGEWSLIFGFTYKGTPITGPLLQETGQIFCKELNSAETDVMASTGSICSWKIHYGVHNVQHIQNHFWNLENIFSLTQKEGIVNCTPVMPRWILIWFHQTLASCGQKSSLGYKRSKEWVMILACNNTSGNHKIKPDFIGHFIYLVPSKI